MAAQRSLITRSIVATGLLLWLLLQYAAPLDASPRLWPVKNFQDDRHRTFYIVPADLLEANDADSDREVAVEVPTLLESPRNMAWSSESRHSGNVIRPMSKRQVRYHQCYFNPISCFGRRYTA